MFASLRFSLFFLVILGAALFTLASANAPSQPDTTAATIRVAIDAPQAPVFTPQERAFEQRLEKIGASLAGEVGIAVIDVETGHSYDFNGRELMPQQSVTKLWVAMAALAQVHAGSLDLNERVTIRREDLTVFYQPIRNIVRAQGSFSSDYSELMERALAQSDNSANDRLLRRIGGADVVQDWLDQSGLGAIRFGADERTKQSGIAGLTWQQSYSYRDEFFKARDRLPDDIRRDAFEAYLADPIDGASALSIAGAFVLLARGELLSQESTEFMRGILARTRSGPRRLKGGLPRGWSIEHKTGTGQFFNGEQSGYNDVGLLVAPDGREYAIAVMIARTREPTPARMDMMQEVTRATAEFHSSRDMASQAAS